MEENGSRFSDRRIVADKKSRVIQFNGISIEPLSEISYNIWAIKYIHLYYHLQANVDQEKVTEFFQFNRCCRNTINPVTGILKTVNEVGAAIVADKGNGNVAQENVNFLEFNSFFLILAFLLKTL